MPGAADSTTPANHTYGKASTPVYGTIHMPSWARAGHPAWESVQLSLSRAAQRDGASRSPWRQQSHLRKGIWGCRADVAGDQPVSLPVFGGLTPSPRPGTAATPSERSDFPCPGDHAAARVRSVATVSGPGFSPAGASGRWRCRAGAFRAPGAFSTPSAGRSRRHRRVRPGGW